MLPFLDVRETPLLSPAPPFHFQMCARGNRRMVLRLRWMCGLPLSLSLVLPVLMLMVMVLLMVLVPEVAG